ncbi:MAG: phosphate acetyltransferase [Phycisphaerae bacterium]|jgi:phosphate acetyltransferase|nr:phosphate acetyltransferase [Phycisphaerae bacterium]
MAAQGIYIAGAEACSGKSVVALGVVEHLAARGLRVGFFRPVIRAGEAPDNLIHLIATRYRLGADYDSFWGVTHETMRRLVGDGEIDEMHSRIIAKYRDIQDDYEYIVCVGTDYTGIAAPLEFDFNADIANNLNCLVLPVVNAIDKNPTQIAAAVGVMLESLDAQNCNVLAIVANRADADQIQAVRDAMNETHSVTVPAYVLPEDPLLSKPTVGEIAEALNAEPVNPNREGLIRKVDSIIVAAMQLPNVLDHIEDDCLVITPRDRADIAIGVILADAATTYPRVSGLMLTGDLKPVGQVHRLLDGLGKRRVPILVVKTDTFTAAMQAAGVVGTITSENEQKIATALSITENHMPLEELDHRLAAARSDRMTPLMFQYELLHRARADRKRIVLPEGTDPRILRATEILLLRKVVDITLLGDEEEIRSAAGALGVSIEGADIVNPLTSPWREDFVERYVELRKHKGVVPDAARDTMTDVSYFGTMMVQESLADGMVSGAAHTTAHTIRPAFQIIRTKPGCVLASSVFLMCLEDRVVVYGDCAINPNPTAEELAHIALSSAETARMFGIEPRVAMLSYSSGKSGKGEDVDRVRQATEKVRSLAPDLKVDGPMQYDAAADQGVGKAKMPDSEVAGQATVFIFPDLNTGNNTYKAVQRTADIVAIGPVMQGLKKPVNDLSRGCTVPDVVNTVAITAIQAQS